MEKLSSVYASALFNLAVEGGAVEEFLDQATFVHDTLKDAECLRIFYHPHINAAEKREFFGKMFAGYIHDDLLGLLYLVIDKNREAYLLPALLALIDMIKRHQNKVTAKVVSAVVFSESQIAALEALLSKKLDKRVEVALKVDPTVIGGPHIYVDGRYLDRTVKGRLRSMTASLAGS